MFRLIRRRAGFDCQVQKLTAIAEGPSYDVKHYGDTDYDGYADCYLCAGRKIVSFYLSNVGVGYFCDRARFHVRDSERVVSDFANIPGQPRFFS